MKKKSNTGKQKRLYSKKKMFKKLKKLFSKKKKKSFRKKINEIRKRKERLLKYKNWPDNNQNFENYELQYPDWPNNNQEFEKYNNNYSNLILDENINWNALRTARKSHNIRKNEAHPTPVQNLNTNRYTLYGTPKGIYGVPIKKINTLKKSRNYIPYGKPKGIYGVPKKINKKKGKKITFV